MDHDRRSARTWTAVKPITIVPAVWKESRNGYPKRDETLLRDNPA